MKSIKKAVAKATEKALVLLAEVFSTMPCSGRWYEPRMPAKLKK